MTRAEALRRGRASFAKRAWESAFSQLSGADLQGPIEPDDLEQLAYGAHLTGRESESNDLLARAHQGFLGAGQTCRAVRCALWLSMRLLYTGEPAQADGWSARARRLLDGQPECVEHGYLCITAGLPLLHRGDHVEALEMFSRAVAFGNRFGDKDLLTLALHAQGRARIRMGDFADGVNLLEAMVAVTAGDVSPVIAGTVYCSVIESCNETLDIRRAHEWTSALNQWCARSPS
jgi:hypothetical protein